MKKIIFTLMLLILVSSVSAGTYNYLQRQGFDTSDQVFTQAEFDYTDYNSENSLATGSKYLMVCSDDVWSTQSEPVCVGVDSSDTMRTYIYNSTSGLWVQHADMTAINTFGAEVSTSGIAGTQALAFADIDNDGLDELIMAGYNTSSSKTQYQIIAGNGTAWNLDWMDDTVTGVDADMRNVGVEIACGYDTGESKDECFILTNDNNDHLAIGWLNDSAEQVNNLEVMTAGTGNTDDNVNNPNYFTCFDVDDDNNVECYFLAKDNGAYGVYAYTTDYLGGSNLATILADVDSVLNGTLDGTDTLSNRLFMNVMDVTASAGEELVFSAYSKDGSDYYVHFAIVSNTGSEIANITITADANSKISQPYMCLHDNEYPCIQAKLPDDNYIIYYDVSGDNFVNNSNLDANCEINAHRPYMPIFESESDSGLTDDFFYFTDASMCSGYTGQEVIGACTISGTTYHTVTDIDDDNSYDFIWFNDDDSCLVISDLGDGVNYQPSVSPLDTYYAEPLCDTETQNWTFVWADVEGDNVQYRSRCHSNLTWGSWSTADTDTTKNISCALNKSNAIATTYLTNSTCNFWNAWCVLNGFQASVDNITVWTQYPAVQVRDDANHVLYINPTQSQNGVGQWANSSGCYDDGSLDTASTQLCGDGVCAGAETVENCPDDCTATTTTLSDDALYVDAQTDGLGNSTTDWYESFGATTSGSKNLASFVILLILTFAVFYQTGKGLLAGLVFVSGAWVFFMIGGMSLLIPLGTSLVIAIIFLFKVSMGNGE